MRQLIIKESKLFLFDSIFKKKIGGEYEFGYKDVLVFLAKLHEFNC